MDKEKPSLEYPTEMAQFIIDHGKMIQDLVNQIIARHLSGDLRIIEMEDISVPQLYAIKAMQQYDGMNITELSEILGVSPPSASTMVDRLVEKGILTRERSKKDRRKVIIGISPVALEKIEKIEEDILNKFVKIVEDIGPETARKWCDVLSLVKEVLKQNDSPKKRYKGATNGRFKKSG